MLHILNFSSLIFFFQKFQTPTLHALDLQKKIQETRLPTREEQQQSMKETEFDILVIGGGATGCGVTLDAASRGEERESVD